MDNGKMEIIVKLSDEIKPRSIRFEDMYNVADKVESLMLLWDANSYYVDVKSSHFLINGGRRLEFPRITDPRLVYRKRTSQTVSISGAAEGSRKSVSWIVGIRDGDEGEMILLIITDTGAAWYWANTL